MERGSSRTTASRRTLKSKWTLNCGAPTRSAVEKAVEVVMEALKKTPPPPHKQPAFPNYHKQ
ncbi:MAG TPA: hypothetical protein VNO24_09000 [Blastocatellia bacterium]|nr:hypothetical protein [Blastocatellia bacterium]